ncbi:MAG: hypothetical protein JSV04_05475, partial [Candidatus Heimdallarchaeota archaeon]
MSPLTAPPPRIDSKAVYDVKSDQILIFGGLYIGLGMYNDSWTYDFNSNTWLNMSPSNIPLGRNAHSLAYDEESDQSILFSGLRTRQPDGPTWTETWAYNYSNNAWLSMTPSIEPSGRAWADMAYDKESDRIILFGGLSGRDTLYAETWAYDFNT